MCSFHGWELLNSSLSAPPRFSRCIQQAPSRRFFFWADALGLLFRKQLLLFCCLWWSKSKMQILLLIVISSVVLTLLPWKIGYIKQPSLEAESEHRAQPLHSPKRSVFLTNDHIMQHRTIYFLRKDEQRRSVAKQNSHQDKSKKFSINLI